MRSPARLTFLVLAVACLAAALPVSALPPEPAVEIADAPRTAMGTHNFVGSDPEACIKPGTVTLSRSPSSIAVGGTVTLTWNDQVIDSYIPVWSLSTSGPWYYLLDPPYTTAVTQMTVTISDPSLAGKTVYFFVRALGSCDLYTDSNIVSVTVTGGGGGGCVGPPTPSLSTNKTSVAAGGSFTLTWSADPYGTTDYWWLGVGTSSSGTYSQVSTYSRTTLSATLSTTAADAGKTLYYRVWAYPYGGSTCESLKTYSNAVSVTVTSGGGGTGCTPDANTLCLYNNRFRVQATYRDYQNNTGTAKAVSLTSDSGYFWFFSQTNVELVAKIVNFCSGSSGSYGLYVSGLTDVNVTFTVTDTKTNQTRPYTNPLGNRYCTVGDAWNACP